MLKEEAPMLERLLDIMEDIKNNKIIILTDDHLAQNGGVFVAASELITKEIINFMMKNGSGFTCISMPEERVGEILLPQMNSYGRPENPNAYLLSVDDISNPSGITAEDRTATIHGLLKKSIDPQHFRSPGHVFIMKASNGGVLKKAGFAEAASDLAKLAGYYPSGTFTEVIGETGEVLKAEQLLEYAKKEDIGIITIEELIAYRRETDCYVVKEAEANLPTEYGDFRMVGFVNTLNGEHHVALVKGMINTEDEVLVRVHSECLTGDAFHSLKCDCGEQLAAALQNIEKEGKGVLLYLRQEGRGIGLINKIKAYKLQEEGLDTEEANIALGFPADMRDYGIGAQILSELNVRKIRLMTNNPKKLVGLKGHGIEIVERVPIIMDTNQYNKRYFETKKEKMGHLY
jgi:3,4-dihydroxy 2-butanone 4-phosphate synthase / GTP cyclohydrolase II